MVATATLASCARAADTAEVSSRPTGPTASSTTTTAPAGVRDATTSRSSSRSSGATATGTGTGDQADLAATAQQLIAAVAADPSLLTQLTGGDVAALSRITGVDAATLQRLQITPDTVRSLASFLTRLDPNQLGRLAALGGRSGPLDPAVAGTILTLAAQLDPNTYAAIRGIDPRALAVLVGTASTVDPKVVDSLGAVLSVVDPNGLGKLAGDKTGLAILAVLFGAALRTDPSTFAQLANANNLDPNLNNVIDGIRNLAAGFSPQVVNTLNGLSKALGPDVLRALSGIIALLGRPDIAPIVQAAAADPVVIASVLGVATLLVPGLAEAVAPETFGNNPNARYALLAGLIGLAVANLNGFDLQQLGALFGQG